MIKTALFASSNNFCDECVSMFNTISCGSFHVCEKRRAVMLLFRAMGSTQIEALPIFFPLLFFIERHP